MEDPLVFSPNQIKQILHAISKAQEEENDTVKVGIAKQDKNWFLKMGVGHSLTLLGAMSAVIFSFGWSMNNRVTALETNFQMSQQYTHEAVSELKTGISDTHKEIVKLSDRLATTK